ncbi:penicillin-binding protein 1C [Hephaestia sp. GCM10023244]|uniref:penicillin-binding protein 1C n=1 Tax=unclassified Hephaestia TaxID=2631281 RepID=UPI0020775E95|nr:penicillin-binding protein 1C [Hephaestia sp. MAHUQ-44]MCM8731209.1 penicillin-binding protein 1C [Hephaestia sp. MAHUQ-44]
MNGPRIALIAILLIAALVAVGDYVTRPPLLPSYKAVKAAWHPSEAWLYDRNGVLIDSVRVDFQVRRLAWTPLDTVSPVMRDTLIAAEDQRFRRHHGIDWLALFGAARDRIAGRRGRGASTLTMQLAGFLAPDIAAPGTRGWFDKVRQMRAARTIEAHWSKDQILEAYLNLAGFRGEAQGIGAAALGLFGKTPDAIGHDDALLLTALLPNPQGSADAIARRACALGHGSVPCDRLQAAAWGMLGPTRSLQLDPELAPHLAVRLLTRPGLRVTSTLDARVQRIATASLARQLHGLAGRARDGAVIVVDNATGDVLAYVGGAGSESTAPAVDGANSYRQAGSTLKPFLYADAIEKGYLTAASILDDSPVQLDTASGLYVPQDYDRSFKGPVSARTALAGSLNVPAVRALVLVGVDQFRDRLWDTGFRGLTEDGQYYGYSLALGSAEVTLMEQVAAFRSLAEGGRWSALRLTEDDPPPAPHAITTPAAAWIVGDMLADPNARVATFGIDSALRLPFWAAVKTGTSKAMRDNWCIGYSDRYTVGVWVGNKEGDPMRGVSGTSGAAPVWRDVMLAIHEHARPAAPARPKAVVAERVGFAGTSEQPRTDYFIAGTGQRRIVTAPEIARRPRIANPVSGSVYAIDPDIPIDRQRLGIRVTGDVTAHRLTLDGRDLGAAADAPLVFASPGQHRLRLVDLDGAVVDQVLFTVR